MKISQKKRERISEQILASLYLANPKPLFTSQIAQRHPDVGRLGSLLPVTVHAGNLDLSGKK